MWTNANRARYGRRGLRYPSDLWDELFPAEQERIVRLLVERVVVSEAGAEITLKLDGIAGLARDLMSRSPELRRSRRF